MQVAAAVAIQMVHDLTFGAWLQQSTLATPTLDIFRRYATEHGAWILIIDASIMTLAVAFSHALARRVNPRDTLLIGTLALYTHLMILDAL